MTLLDKNIKNIIKIFDFYEEKTDEECIKNITENKINLKQLNHRDFDVLLFAIYKDLSVDMMKYIIDEAEYQDLNYVYTITKKFKKYVNFDSEDNNNNDDDDDEEEEEEEEEEGLLTIDTETTPLFMAIGGGNFQIANFLMEKGADINYKLIFDMDVTDYLYTVGNFDKRKLKFVFNHGFNIQKVITPIYLVKYNIQFKSSHLLKHILDRYVFNNDFILQFLYIYNNRHSLSYTCLKKMVAKERNKVSFDEHIYSFTIHLKRYDTINLFLDYDSKDRVFIYNNIVKKYNFLNEALISNNSKFIAKVLTYEMPYMKNDELTKILNYADNNQYIKDGIIIFLNICLNKKYKNTFEKICLMASKNNNKKVIHDILSKIIINNYPLESSDSQHLSLLLNMAVKIENLWYIEFLLKNFNINSKMIMNKEDRNGELPLFNALKHFNSGNIDSNCFYYLINHGANINIKNSHGLPLLMIEALQNKQYKALNYILKNPFIINLDINDNYSPFIKAIYTNNILSVKSFLKESRNKNNRNKRKCIRYKESPFIPLILAYLLNRKEICSLLINELNINILDDNNYSILHYAVLKEDLDTIKALIQKGADPNMQNKGINPLEMAMAIENRDIFSILLSSEKMDINKCNDKGETSFIRLLKMDSSFFKDSHFKPECMKALINKGSLMDVTDDSGKAALFYAIEDQCHSYFMTKMLLDYGVNTNVSLAVELDKDSPKNPKNDNMDVDITVPKKTYSMSPLFFAVQCHTLPVLKLLIERAFSKYCESFYERSSKRTLLSFTTYLGYIDIFKYLMEWDKDFKFTENEHQIIDIINCCLNEDRIEIFQYFLERKFSGKHLPINILKFILQSKKFDFIETLFKMKDISIDLSLVGKECDELLIAAMEIFRMFIISYLIKHGVNPQPIIKNDFYRSIIIHDFDLEFFKILKEHGLDIHYQWSDTGYTFLYYAIIEGDVETVKYLIEQGVNTNVTCWEGTMKHVNELYFGSSVIEQLLDNNN